MINPIDYTLRFNKKERSHGLTLITLVSIMLANLHAYMPTLSLLLRHLSLDRYPGDCRRWETVE